MAILLNLNYSRLAPMHGSWQQSQQIGISRSCKIESLNSHCWVGYSYWKRSESHRKIDQTQKGKNHWQGKGIMKHCLPLALKIFLAPIFALSNLFYSRFLHPDRQIFIFIRPFARALFTQTHCKVKKRTVNTNSLLAISSPTPISSSPIIPNNRPISFN